MSPTPDRLAALRREYTPEPLRRESLDADPIRQFQLWFDEALARELPEPNAMTLATVDAAGHPSTRTVLLKACDARGFSFFTNYRSAKARQIEAHPYVALTFWWAALQRQINVAGVVSRTSREETERYFLSRPVNSRLGAWASSQSEVLASRAELERQFAEARARFGEAEIPAPPHWGGYCVEPSSIEFWQGQRSRLHDRLRYSRPAGGAWRIERLAP
jgi:pyridoxamine 5'-phosphate oxidase